MSVPYSQQDWWKSSEPARCTYNLQPDLLGSFLADVCSNITGQSGCGHRAKFSSSVVRGGRREFLTNSRYHSYSRYQIASDTLNCLLPSNTFTFLPRTYYFFSQPAKIWLENRCFEAQIHWVPLYSVRGKKTKNRQVTKFCPYQQGRVGTFVGSMGRGMCNPEAAYLPNL